MRKGKRLNYKRIKTAAAADLHTPQTKAGNILGYLHVPPGKYLAHFVSAVHR